MPNDSLSPSSVAEKKGSIKENSLLSSSVRMSKLSIDKHVSIHVNLSTTGSQDKSPDKSPEKSLDKSSDKSPEKSLDKSPDKSPEKSLDKSPEKISRDLASGKYVSMAKSNKQSKQRTPIIDVLNRYRYGNLNGIVCKVNTIHWL